MNLGEKIKKIRCEGGLTQKEVAKKSGITVSFLSQVEKNKATPSLKSLHNIAQALGIRIDYLFSEDVHNHKIGKIIKKSTNEELILENGESLSFYLD
jgi:transcriptional regulator with XRE-family HTH domain